MTDNPGTHTLASGPRAKFIGQSLRAIVASEEGAAYLQWASRGGGTFAAEDLAAIRAYLKCRRQTSQPDPVSRRWPSAFLPNKRRETGS